MSPNPVGQRSRNQSGKPHPKGFTGSNENYIKHRNFSEYPVIGASIL